MAPCGRLLYSMTLVPMALGSRVAVAMKGGNDLRVSGGVNDESAPARSFDANSHATEPLQAVRRLIEASGGASTDTCWTEKAERMGCKAECKCSVFEACYPKFVSVLETSPGVSRAAQRVNIGICSLAMPMLIVSSGALFISLLGFIVAVRMYCQWRDNRAAAQEKSGTDGDEHAKGLAQKEQLSFASPQPTRLSPTSEGEETVDNFMQPAWPEGEIRRAPGTGQAAASS